MTKMKLREIEMDPMECLYYERQYCRKKAYAARQRKALDKRRRESVAKNPVDVTGTVAFSQISLKPI